MKSMMMMVRGAVLVLSLGLVAACGDDAEATPGDGVPGDGMAGDGDAADVGDGDGSAAGDGDATAAGDGDASAAGDGDGDAGGAGAGTGSDALPPADDYTYSACTVENRVGGFQASAVTLATGATFSSVNGRIFDGLTPANIPDVRMTVGDCSLVEGRDLFCDPACAVGEVCDLDGQCIAEPTTVSAGSVEVRGLIDGTASMEPRQPRLNYEATGTLSYPAFEEGAVIALDAAGADVPAMSLQAEGVAPLEIEGDALELIDGQPATLTWTPPAQAGRSRVLASVNISLHGGDPFRIECDTDDDGTLEIAAELVSELLSITYSGFPGVSLTRQTAHAVDGPDGCIDFRVESVISRHEVAIDGLTSCNEDQPDCPDGQSCNLEFMQCE